MLFWSAKFSVSPEMNPTIFTVADVSVEEAESLTVKLGARAAAAPPPWNAAGAPGDTTIAPSAELKVSSAYSENGAAIGAAAGALEASRVQLAGSALPIACVA